ncbi:MAG: thiamine-binding protein [Gemella sp.]|nr:thiamine-binding protein [Gemella sp.]
MNSSISIQILPLSNVDRIALIDEIIAFIKSRHDKVEVGPFETVIEGEFPYVMETLQKSIELAGQDCDNIFANVKINYGNILSIDEKVTKHRT